MLRFGTAVKELRNNLGLSQEDLAERAGLDRTYVGHVERGARNVSLSTIDKLAHALQVSAGALLATVNSPAQFSVPDFLKSSQQTLVDILIVEDKRRDAELTLSAFKRAKINNPVIVLTDGAQALDYLFCTGAYADRDIAERPQLLLLDLTLPKISGMEVLRRVKADKRTQSIPVVILSASEKNEDIAESRELGADAYIIKPVDSQSLLKATPDLDLQWALLKPFPSAPEGLESRA